MNIKRNTLRLRLCTWVAAGLLGVMASAANAAVLYSQPTFDQADAIFPNFVGGPENADSFLLGGAVNVSALRWWGSYLTADSDNFTLRLFADDSGFPAGGALKEYTGITVSRIGSGMQDIGGGEVFQYEYDLPDVVVLSSGTYYLSVMNDTSVSEWLWSVASSGDGSSFVRSASSDPWESADSDLAFEVIGTRQTQTVPEPESAALVAMAGACLLLARRRVLAKKN